MMDKDDKRLVIFPGCSGPDTLSFAASFFSRLGYDVLLINYDTTKQSLPDLVKNASEQIGADGRPLSILTYSYGALVGRAYLTEHIQSRVKRVVMLAPPNNGSKLADFFANFPEFKNFYGKASEYLRTDQTAFAHMLGDVYYETGIIAGNEPSSKDRFFVSRLKGLPSDGFVTLESTKLAGATQFQPVPIPHNKIPNSSMVLNLAANFIERGNFDLQKSFTADCVSRALTIQGGASRDGLR